MRTIAWIALLAIASVSAFTLGMGTNGGPSKSPAAILDAATQPPSLNGSVATSTPSVATSAPSLAADQTSIADIAAIASEFARTRAVIELAENADEQMLQTFIRDAQAIAIVADRGVISELLLLRYIEIDPQAAVDFLMSENFQLRPNYVNRVFLRWARLDLDQAIGAALALPPSVEKQAANDGILQAYAPEGGDRIAEISARLTNDSSVELQPNSVLRLSNADPAAAMTQAEELPPDIGARVAVTIGQTWGMRDPEEAYRYASSLSDSRMQAPLMDGLFSSWITTDPVRVVQILDSGVGSDERAYIIRSGTDRMARAMPREAFDLIRAMRDPIARDAAAKDALQLWAEQDPAAAAAALETFETRDKDGLGMAVGHQYARANPERALEWAIRYDDGYGETWRNTLSEIARRDPQRSFALAALTPESDRQRAYTISVSSMAQIDTDVATRYWEQLPEAVKPEGAWYVVLEWVKRDTDAAANWLLGMPGGAARDRGLTALLNEGTIDTRDYPRLLNAISEPRQRDSRASRVLRDMIGSGDLVGAESLLGQLSLSADTYQSIRNRIDNAR